MMVTISNSNQYGPLREEELLRFEKLLNKPLPAEYRAFLLIHNGGIPEPGDFVISAELGYGNVSEFFGLHEGPQYANLSWQWAIRKNYLPTSLLPIGTDPGGKPICISLIGENSGKVYFWDHEMDDFSQRFGYRNPYPLADNFATFLDTLFAVSEDGK